MTQTFVEKELAAARSRPERTWDRLVDRRERKLEEVDQIERRSENFTRSFPGSKKRPNRKPSEGKARPRRRLEQSQHRRQAQPRGSERGSEECPAWLNKAHRAEKFQPARLVGFLFAHERKRECL